MCDSIRLESLQHVRATTARHLEGFNNRNHAAQRYSLPQARILLHQPHGTAEGQAVDIEIQAKEFVRNRELMNGIIAEHTGQLIERVSRDTDRDFILTAEQAVEYGAVDEVITSRKIRPLLAAAPAEGS
ncbi:MAG: ATP-dependent Clp protease proteolytic subunit [Actinomycetota bacterium]|nr:ATP-dependent Clp protease proteolytic subunit [Actinomycetota bacterium]